MASVEECEKLRKTAEVKLQEEIYKLKDACETPSPNKRRVANLVASLHIAQHNLCHSQLSLDKKRNGQRDDCRYTQFFGMLMDAAEERKALVDAITGAVDEKGVPTPQTVHDRRLRRDCAVMVWSIRTQLVEYKEAMQTQLSEEQYKELTKGVEQVSDMLYVQLRELRNNLQKTLSWDTDWLEEELYKFYNYKLPELEELRRYCEEVHKQYTTDYV